MTVNLICGDALAELAQLLERKAILHKPQGIDISSDDLSPQLFPFQRAITAWAIRKGRCAIFADTGLGKTPMQLEWAHRIGGRSLVVAPLSVARQTVRIGGQFGIPVHYTRSGTELSEGINITNYEMLDHFDPSGFRSVVLDESSILKSLAGKTRRKLISMFGETPYRLCCTATPAPNDPSEIGNHSEFLGVLSMADMLATFFVHDEQEWRLKGHGRQAYYEWMASWAMSIRKPSDLGFDDAGYDLPPLEITPTFVSVAVASKGKLFFTGLSGISDRASVRRSTTAERVAAAAALVNGSGEQWILWCGMNGEADACAKAIAGSRNVQGADSIDSKVADIEAFQDGQFSALVTKPKICGHGMNLQNCHNMIFVGMNDSWETYYQCIRRCYRFGQTQPVRVYLVLSEAESEIYQNVMRKESQAREMSDELIRNVQQYETEEIKGRGHSVKAYREDTVRGENWTAMLGDSCKRLAEVATESIHLSVYSPPFANLYTYSASECDLGNCRDWEQFFEHYAYIIKELLRVTLPGRLTAVHASDIPAMLVKDGYIGFKDFPGEVVRAYIAAGWIFHGRITIDKDPQAQAIRTKSKGLSFGQMEKDSSWSRPALGDYVLLFRKPGENATPIRPVENGELDRDTWIEWARPVWYGISEGDTLQYTTARDPEDERHICPLQLGVVERCIKLWTNPGETVLTPFGGIGTEAYQAVRLGRRAILIELKPGYFRVAVGNLGAIEAKLAQGSLFSGSKA